MICSPCVAHKCVSVWEEGVILRGEHLDMFFLVCCGCCHCSAWSVSGLHLLPLLRVFQPPRGSDRLVPGASRRQNSQPRCSRWRKNRQGFSFFFFGTTHILRTVNVSFFFSILVVSVEQQFSENYETFSEQKIQLF